MDNNSKIIHSLTGVDMDFLSKYHVGRFEVNFDSHDLLAARGDEADFGTLIGSDEVTMSMPCVCFATLVRELKEVYNKEPIVIQQELQESDKVWVVRFPTSRGLKEVNAQSIALSEQYPNQKMVWLPSDESIDQMGPDELKEVYNYLGKAIDNFSYDKIMDF